MGVTATRRGFRGGASRGPSAMREKPVAVLGEVPGQGIVYRQSSVVSGESCYIRERARALGMSMQDLAERVGVTPAT